MQRKLRMERYLEGLRASFPQLDWSVWRKDGQEELVGRYNDVAIYISSEFETGGYCCFKRGHLPSHWWFEATLEAEGANLILDKAEALTPVAAVERMLVSFEEAFAACVKAHDAISRLGLSGEEEEEEG